MSLFRRNGHEPPVQAIKSMERHRITVHTKDKQSIEGVLWAVYGDVIVLRHATYLSPEPTEDDPGRVARLTLNGDAVIERGNVSFYQAGT